MQLRLLFAAACLALAACGQSGAGAPADPAVPLSASLDTLPATVEGRLFEVDAEPEDGVVYASFEYQGNALSVKLPEALASSLDVPADGARVRVTIGSEEIEDGDSTLVITAATRL